MPRKRMVRRVLPAIWHVPDELGARVKPLLDEYDPPPIVGRPRIDQRAILDAIIFRLRSGCQWNLMPQELPDDSTVHRTLQRWVRLGVLDRIWAALVEDCDELGGVNWEWQAADGCLIKAPLAIEAVGPNPTDRKKKEASGICWSTSVASRCRSS